MPDFTMISAFQGLKKNLLLAAFCAFFSVQAFATEEKTPVESQKEYLEHEKKAEASETSGKEEKTGAEGEEKSGKFSPGEMIMEHVTDAHDWHLFGHVAIPLPVILYTKSQGLSVFMSSNFHHGEHPYGGFKLTEKGKVVWENESNKEAIYDFSITKNVFAMLLAVITLLIIMLGISRAYDKRKGKAPKGLQNLLEPLILFIRDDIARPNIGAKTDKYLPMLLTIFFFIFINNLFGLIPIFPGGANVTGNIAVTLVLSAIVFIVVTISANKYYWKHIFLPDVPKAMYIILVPIEILGVFLRPFVLMLRLFANITAGHIIILGFFSLIFIFGAMKPGLGLAVSPLSVAFTVFMSLLELLVAFLQAFVFTLLTAIYIGMAVEDHGHSAEHH